MHFPYIQAASSSLYDLGGIDIYPPMAFEEGTIDLPDLVYPYSSPSSSPSSLNTSPRTPPATVPEQSYSESVSSVPEEQGHIPRPRNAFIIFRSQFGLSCKAREAHPHQNFVSRGAAEAWNKLSDEEKHPYRLQADEEKREHRRKYPNYTYMPGCRNTKRGASATAKRAQASKPYSPPQRKTGKVSKKHNVETPDASACTTPVSSSSPVMGYITMEEMLANYTQIDTMDGDATALSLLDRIDPQFGFRPELAYTTFPAIPEPFVAPVDSAVAPSTVGDSLLNSGPLAKDELSLTLFDMLYHTPLFENDILSDTVPDHITRFYDNGYQNYL
ncbi:hypothetical protein F5887DRAFT_297550 [Amanita rubescens]|nr:hypothetical protein F5887DRAFT_297550 [Amanita rubescens]